MDVQPALITSPYRNNHPFYYGGFAIPSPSYRMPGQFGSLIPYLGMKYDYGLYARPGAPYGPLPMFPPGSFGGTLPIIVSAISFQAMGLFLIEKFVCGQLCSYIENIALL